ncbi:glycerol-3-phosphate dehydrogenase, mitochondrial [Ischnura elegans]|uniref:glycerol-3-phosphate dehydrogenase, mitochondrial n=1 Tax=Ischnura elegans TaxID=197161 RepID=UPI001ED8908F|nr:glycerol-3-phosphate dehydrogenase, mitochondrial [Ischnura elegans]XP_046386755.1 glycerol-3-phosphate dehydrogenase, mitochondrial [Ischnura elegans]
MASSIRKVIAGGLTIGAGAYITNLIVNNDGSKSSVVSADSANDPKRIRPARHLPTRAEQIQSLKRDNFDVLIVGGGATGSGCAVDAVTRGLKTAMVEIDDFGSGTSSRSTKLIHGGVRYLQTAILRLDIEQYRMVKEALNERANMLKVAPHLAHPLPIMLPVYNWWQIPYFWVGIKAYDIVAGTKLVKSSYYLSKKNALELFPMLKKDELKGAIVYYDGQQNDARMNLVLALTATRHGATVANHVEVTSLLKGKEKGPNGAPQLIGARVKDRLTGEEWNVSARCIINATGPFTDSLRQMDDPSIKPICAPSAGVHIVLPGYYSPDQMGLLDPATSDGRVIFFLPWEKHTIAGTTDSPCDVTHHPAPTEDDILFILDEIKNYLSPDIEVRRGDVLSAWSGIRPLVQDPNKEDTQSLARNHIVHVSPSGLVTIAGGKWTTYRSMAADTIDAAIKATGLKPACQSSQTKGLYLEGGHNWSPTMFIRLVQDFGLECETAQHLASAYGDRAFAVAKLATLTGKRWPIIGKKLHPEFPYIDAEVRYAVKEYACTAIDVIARRLRLAFLNVQAAQEALPGIIDLMGEELKWSEKEKKAQFEAATHFLQSEMGHNVNRASQERIPIDLTKEEVATYRKRFQAIDQERKGYVSINDIRRSMERTGEKVSGEMLHEILRELDTNMNGQVELDEYLQMMSAIKSGYLSHSRFARMAEMEEEHVEKERARGKISVERSGGGL